MFAKISIVLASLGAALMLAAKVMSGALDPMTGIAGIYSALGPGLAVLHIHLSLAQHVEDEHSQNPPGSSFADRVKAQGGRASLGATAALCAIVFLVLAGCAAIIPATHVKADLARHRSQSAAWIAYVRTGYGPDGATLSAAFRAACEANYAAEERDILEEAKAAGLAPATATSTAEIAD